MEKDWIVRYQPSIVYLHAIVSFFIFLFHRYYYTSRNYRKDCPLVADYAGAMWIVTFSFLS